MARRASLSGQLGFEGASLEIDLPPRAEFIADDTVVSARTLGKIRIELDREDNGFRSLRLARLTMFSEGAQLRGHTGKLFLEGIGGGTFFALPFSARWIVNLDLSATMVYRALGRRLPGMGRGLDEEDLEQELDVRVSEDLRGHLEMVLVAQDSDDSNTRWRIITGRLRLIATRKVWAFFDELMFDFSPRRGEIRETFSGAVIHRAATADVAPSTARTLWLKPFGFASNAMTTGRTWETQLEEAKRFWEGCCLKIESEPLTILSLPELVASREFSSIYNQALDHIADHSRVDWRLNAVEVFINNGPLAKGGGTTFLYRNDDGALALVIMTDLAEQNSHLLAHELGHVLGGTHPNETPSPRSGLWKGELNTVLEPSDSLSRLNPGFRPLGYCHQIRNKNIIEEAGGPCQLSEFRVPTSA